ncbi:hypothetical protein R69746_08856 [Paraburkholderia aspalathi]|nr:hypothetical protein R69746_08856 [Paraburkholderia aspalathi]
MSEHTNSTFSHSGLPIIAKNFAKLSLVRSCPTRSSRVQPASIW